MNKMRPFTLTLLMAFCRMAIWSQGTLVGSPLPEQQNGAAVARKSEESVKKAKAAEDGAKKSAEDARQDAIRAHESEQAAAQSLTKAITSQHGADKSADKAAESRKAAEAMEKQIRRTGEKIKVFIQDNGINVGPTKVFDNRTLAIMLENLSETLRTLQVVEQEPLRKALGLLQGSQTKEVSRSFSVLAGGSPKIVTTLDGSTETSNTDRDTALNGIKDAKEQDYLEELIEKKVTEKLGSKMETTRPERLPALPALADALATPTGLPGFGQNSLDLLSDQVNLTYQIFNLRMVIDRSLTDRLHDGQPKLQAVLGFNVSLDPPRDAVDSAAVVEITVSTEDGKPLSLVSLMPQEKTYNAVALSQKINSFGGSAAVKMVTVGYSERRRGQIFYLYRDNDTLSFERMMANSDELVFGWQFRPVLGRRSVSPGLRQMFAVVSIPEKDLADCKDDIKLVVTRRTYWRKYYSDTLTTADRGKIGPWPYVARALSLGLSQSVPSKLQGLREDKASQAVTVPTTAKYQTELGVEVQRVRWAQMDGKNAVVSVEGKNFFSGTTVIIGGTTHSAATGSLIVKSNQIMDVIVPLDSVGAGSSMVIGRYGRSVPLIDKELSRCPLKIEGEPTLSEPYGGKRVLDLSFNSSSCFDPNQPFLVYAGAKRVLGRFQAFPANGKWRLYEDIPTEEVPKAEGSLTIVYPFGGSIWSLPFHEPSAVYEVIRTSGGTTPAPANPIGAAVPTATERVIVFLRRKDLRPFTNSSLFGPQAAQQWAVHHKGVPMTKEFLAGDTFIKVELTNVAEGDQILLFEPHYIENRYLAPRPYVFEIPPVKAKEKVAVTPANGTQTTLAQNSAPVLVFTGDSLASVRAVVVEGLEPLRYVHDAAKKTLTIWLTQTYTRLPGGPIQLQFKDEAGKQLAAVPLTVAVLPEPNKAKGN